MRPAGEMIMNAAHSLPGAAQYMASIQTLLHTIAATQTAAMAVAMAVPPTMPIFSPPTSMMALPFSLPFSTSDCEASILADSTGNFTAKDANGREMGRR